MLGRWCEGLNGAAVDKEDLTMKLVSMVVVASACVVGATAALAGASFTPNARVLAPIQAATFDVGSKRAVTYYEPGKNLCRVSVLVADRYDANSNELPTAVRFSSIVPGGTSTRVETPEGPSLALACAPGATKLFVQTIDRVAYVAGAK